MKGILLSLVLVLLTACASTPVNTSTSDPFEQLPHWRVVVVKTVTPIPPEMTESMVCLDKKMFYTTAVEVASGDTLAFCGYIGEPGTKTSFYY